MPNVRRLLLTAAFAFLVAWVVGGVAGCDKPPEPAAAGGPLRVKVEQPHQPEAEGTAAFPGVRLKVPHGTLDLDLAHVRSLSVDDVEGGTVRATAEMADHSRQTGELLTRDLPVAFTSGPHQGDTQPLAPEAGLKITFVHPADTGLLAALIGLLTLTVMEIVLGIDNIIFLAIVAGKLPEAQQPLARRIGLGAALGTRLILLCTLTFLLGLTAPLFHLPPLPFLHEPEARGVSWRDLILLVGGLFLVGKSVKEIHEKIAEARGGGHDPDAPPKKAAGFVLVIVQIAVIDIIFSLDSVITAVGMVEKDHLWVMITAVILAVLVMLAFAEPVSRFVDKNPTIKLLALSFLILIGVLLLAEGLGQHVDKGYVYFAMGFAVVMELLNMRLRPKGKAKTPPAEPPLPPTGV